MGAKPFRINNSPKLFYSYSLGFQEIGVRTSEPGWCAPGGEDNKQLPVIPF